MKSIWNWESFKSKDNTDTGIGTLVNAVTDTCFKYMLSFLSSLVLHDEVSSQNLSYDSSQDFGHIHIQQVSSHDYCRPMNLYSALLCAYANSELQHTVFLLIVSQVGNSEMNEDTIAL